MDEKLRLYDAHGDCLARDNLLIVFFGRKPFADMVQGVAYCVERYLQMVPDQALQWAIIGSNSGTYRKLSKRDLERCLSMMTVKTAKQKNIHFRLLGPEIYGPDYALLLNGYQTPVKRGFLDQTNAIEMRFPREYLITYGEDSFVATVKDMFDKTPCDSGYGSLSLCFGKESRFDQAGDFITPLAFRSHGFDIPDTLATGTHLGNRSRGARWLTMLDATLVDELGGQELLGKQLPKGVEVLAGSHGVLLRAGRNPELGDVNRRQDTPLLASVAQAIKPVTYFGDNSLLPLFGNDEERRDRWEQRFFPE